MNNRRASRQHRLRLAILTAGIVCLVAMFAGAEPPLLFGKVKGFKIPEYYPPPNQKQMRSLLRGDEAEPDGKDRILIHRLRVETFRENGDPEAFVEAPECVYDTKTREASSAGPLKAYSADHRLQIEGTGFLLVTSNKSLTISNNVRTVIRDLGNTNKFMTISSNAQPVARDSGNTSKTP